MQQQILSLGLEQLESEERIMLHVGKIPRGFENWLSRCIWTSQSSCCSQPLPMTLWVLSGPKGNSCHFAIFWRDGTCLRLYNLKILPASRIFLPPQNTWMSPDSRQIWIFPVPRSALTCFATLPAFFGILMARPHERRSNGFGSMVSQSRKSTGQWNHYVFHPWKTNIDTQNDEALEKEPPALKMAIFGI